MKIKSLFWFSIVSFTITCAQDALKNYITDDSDLEVMGYDILKMTNNQTFSAFTLNVTTLKWFDGNRVILKQQFNIV